jgi:hypothetical protein
MKYKKGQVFKSINSDLRIQLVSRKTHMGHWNTKKLGSRNAHSVHEGTLQKFYELERAK